MHTKTQPNWFSTTIWLLLVALTLVTFRIGQAGNVGQGATLAVLLIALIKGQMVANYFMGLRRVHTGWRILILAYFLIVGGLIALAYQMA